MKTHFNFFGRGRRLRIAIMFTCQLAFILFGYDQGVFSGIVDNTNWLDTFGNPGTWLEGIIVSIYNLGAFSGCIVAFLFAEKLGRRKCMWLAMVFIVVGAILQCSSYSVPQIMVARYITGIGTGIETSTVPIYQSELCEASKRGRLVSAEPLFVGVGIVIAYFFDYGMSFVGGELAWRLPIACQIIFALIVVVIVFGVPESPRWLYKEGRGEEALQVLCDVYDCGPDDAKVIKEQTEVLDVLALERQHGEYKWSQLFKRDDVQTGRRILLAYGMQFMNQVGGINLVVYYAPSALEYNVGLSYNLALLIGGFVETMFFFGSLFPTFFLDFVGRRRPMMIGSIGCAVSMMLIAVLLSFTEARGYSAEITKQTSSASVAFFFTYMLSFGATANCVPWVYVPEILPLHARAKGSAIATSSNWIWNFVIVIITPTLIDKLEWQAYFIFMCTNLAFVPLVYFCYPETNNLTLEEVDYLFVTNGDREKSGGGLMRNFMTGPVRVSLRSDVRNGGMRDVLGKGDVEKEGREKDAALHLEHAGTNMTEDSTSS